MEGVSSEGLHSFGFTLFLLACFVLFAYIYISIFKQNNNIKNKDEEDSGNSSNKYKQNKSSLSNKSTSQPGSKISKKLLTKSVPKHTFSNPDLHCSFKGHTEIITSGSVSSNGKGLVTASTDRTLFFYNLRDAFNSSGGSAQGTRTNIHLDHVLKLCWSPDYTAIVVQKADALKIEVLRGTKKADGTLKDMATCREFPKSFPERLVTLSIANNGKFIMTCDVNNQLYLWDLKGEQLALSDTRHGNTLSARLSLDDRFIITTGFTPDAKVWEIEYDKGGNFKSVKKVFELIGHNSKVFSSDASPDSTKMVTVSKDGTWRLYNTNVEYQQGQDPKLMVTGTVEAARSVTDVDEYSACVVRLSPDSRVVLVTVMADVYCYSATNAQLLREISNIYAGPVLDVFFDAANQYFLTIGGTQAHMFHNVAGHLAAIQDLESSLKAASYSGMKDRINSQLEAAKRALKKVQDKQNPKETKKKK